jgi:hypothetical protein
VKNHGLELLDRRDNTSAAHTFFTDQEATGFGFSALKSSNTPSCSAGAPLGQLRRARTANALPSGEQHAAAGSVRMRIRCKCLLLVDYN